MTQKLPNPPPPNGSRRPLPPPAPPPKRAAPDDLARERRLGKIEGYTEAILALVPMMDRLQTLRVALDEHLGGFLDDLGRWKVQQEAKAQQLARIK